MHECWLCKRWIIKPRFPSLLRTTRQQVCSNTTAYQAVRKHIQGITGLMLFSSDWTQVTFAVTAELHFLRLRLHRLREWDREVADLAFRKANCAVRTGERGTTCCEGATGRSTFRGWNVVFFIAPHFMWQQVAPLLPQHNIGVAAQLFLKLCLSLLFQVSMRIRSLFWHRRRQRWVFCWNSKVP